MLHFLSGRQDGKLDGKLDQATRTSRIINSPQGELLKTSLEPEHHLTFTYENGKSTGTY